ncbi:MAG: 6-carboxytetrahydropterin synthase QueD [Desulfatibacillaceae bacterium]
MARVFEVSITTGFAAAHRLDCYPGDCRRIHGHNWRVDVFVQCRALDDLGMGIDFRDIETHAREVVGGLDHRLLNDLDFFADKNPTAENVAVYVYRGMQGLIDREGVRVTKVRVFESPGAGVTYWEED